MTLCVCGSRTIPARHPGVLAVLDWLDPAELRTGDAAGADSIAASWALTHRRPLVIYRALWARYKRAAGKRRSAEMVAALPPGSAVVAFYHGFTKSSGTAFTVDLANEKGLKVIEYVIPE